MEIKTRTISEQHRAAIAEGQRRSWGERREQRLAAIQAPEVRAKISTGKKQGHATRYAGDGGLDAIQMRTHRRAEKWLRPRDLNLTSLQRLLCGRW